jgi:hypothetical protein
VSGPRTHEQALVQHALEALNERRRADQRRKEENEHEQTRRFHELLRAALGVADVGELAPYSNGPRLAVVAGYRFRLEDDASDRAVLLLETACPICQRAFQKAPVREPADVGELVDEFMNHDAECLGLMQRQAT